VSFLESGLTFFLTVKPDSRKDTMMERGIGEDSKIIDLDFDPSDLSMEVEYLSKIQYETDVLSLPIEKRRKIQKQKMIAEYMLKIGKADIDGVESNCDRHSLEQSKNTIYRLEGLIEDDCDYVEIDGEVYKIN
jgi:hypothetical protein